MRAISKTIHYSEYDLTVCLTTDGAVYYSVDSGFLYPFSVRVAKSAHGYYVCPIDDPRTKYHQGSKNSCYFFIVNCIRKTLSL